MGGEEHRKIRTVEERGEGNIEEVEKEQDTQHSAETWRITIDQA